MCARPGSLSSELLCEPGCDYPREMKGFEMQHECSVGVTLDPNFP